MRMGSRLPQISRVLGSSAIGLHAVLLIAVVAVPVCALWRAVSGLASGSGSGQLGTLIELGRWPALLANTLIVSAVALLTAVVLGLVVGFLVARTDLPGRTLITLAAVLGACVPVYVSVVFIFALIPVWQFAHSAVACGVMHGLVCTPLAVIVLAAVFRWADRDLEDQARLDGDDWTVVWRVIIPQAGWGIVATAMIVVLLVSTDQSIADILVVRTFAEEVYTQYALHRTAAGPVLVGIPVLAVLAVMLVGVQVRYRLLGEHSPWQFGARPRTILLGPWRGPAAALCLVALLALLGPPAVALLKHVRPISTALATTWAVQPELLRSAAGASAGATLVVLFGVGLAWAALRTRRLRWPVCGAVVLLLAMPAPVAGISLIDLLNRPGLIGGIFDSSAAVIFGYIVRFLPFGILLLIPAIQRVPLEHELAARIDGCGWLGVQRHVYWPAVIKPVLVVWLVILILCFGEVGTTILLAPPGWPTASVRAATLIHFGVYRDLAVLALLSVAYIVLPWLALIGLVKRAVGGEGARGGRQVISEGHP
jgi:iron(III) transport system permease protein